MWQILPGRLTPSPYEDHRPGYAKGGRAAPPAAPRQAIEPFIIPHPGASCRRPGDQGSPDTHGPSWPHGASYAHTGRSTAGIPSPGPALPSTRSPGTEASGIIPDTFTPRGITVLLQCANQPLRLFFRRYINRLLDMPVFLNPVNPVCHLIHPPGASAPPLTS